MNIGNCDKAKTIFKLLRLQEYLPYGRRLGFIFRPLDATRYTEFTYILKHFEKKGLGEKNIEKVLDISSPYVLAYYFHKIGYHVVKMDIDPKEHLHVNERVPLDFKVGDARKLSFHDNSFDFVYSISVLEHIYCDYLSAVKEMIRVTKTGGIIYVTFPVAEIYTEEWLDSPIYSAQARKGGKTFFQYRFDEAQVIEIKDVFLSSCRTISCDIYWERKRGSYDKLVKGLRFRLKFPALNMFKDSFLHSLFGWLLFPGKSKGFSKASAFGNLHMLVEKQS